MKAISPEEADRIANLPQRSREWKAARMHRVTGSRVHDFAGRAGEKKQMAAMQSMCFTTFEGNFATRHGTKMEDVAEEVYLTYLKNRYAGNIREIGIEHEGLRVSPLYPNCGASLDGIATIVFWDNTFLCYIVEYKCPIGDIYPTIPPRYADQMLFGGGIYQDIMKRKWAALERRGFRNRHSTLVTDFVVYKQTQPISVRTVEWKKEDFVKLMDDVNCAYRELFVPGLRMLRDEMHVEE